MDRVQFLTLDELLALHERLIERFGGSVGVRDLGLAESALFRPKSGYYDDVVEMAAALFESLVMNHAFVDGVDQDVRVEQAHRLLRDRCLPADEWLEAGGRKSRGLRVLDRGT